LTKAKCQEKKIFAAKPDLTRDGEKAGNPFSRGFSPSSSAAG